MQRKWMGRLILALFLIQGTSQGALHAGAVENWFSSWWNKEKSQPATMRVLLVHNLPGVVLEVKGKYKLYDPHMESFISTRFVGKRKFVQTLRDGLKWGEEFPGIHQIKIVPADSKTTTLVDGVEYNGNIYIYDIGGAISIVNEVPLEEYLKSILIPQFERKSSNEVAAALAITARTNAWYYLKNPSNPYWVVDAGRVGYQGSAATIHDQSGFVRAVDATKNMVLAKDGELFPASWTMEVGTNSKPIISRLSVGEAEVLADKGEHAAQILQRAFPGSSVSLIDKLN